MSSCASYLIQELRRAAALDRANLQELAGQLDRREELNLHKHSLAVQLRLLRVAGGLLRLLILLPKEFQ